MVEKWPAADPHPDPGESGLTVQCVTSGLCLQSSVDGSLLVTSTLITPDLGDAGAELECRVNTPGLPEVREHTWHLPVQCK